MLGFVNHPLKITEPVPGDHRANIRIGLKTFNRRSENGSGSEFLGPSHNHIMEFVVLGLVDDKLLDADAVLTSVLAELNSEKCATVRGRWGTYKIPRIQILMYRSRSVPGMMIAGSFPPSSKVNGVMFSAAASATLRPTSSDPINVMCLMTGDLVRISASAGRQHTT